MDAIDSQTNPAKVIWVQNENDTNPITDAQIQKATERNVGIIVCNANQALTDIKPNTSVALVLKRIPERSNTKTDVAFLESVKKAKPQLPIYVYSNETLDANEERRFSLLGVHVLSSATFEELLSCLCTHTDRLFDGHPSAKLKANLAALPPDNTKELVILIATGSYCPVHRMHVEVFNVAKEHLESNYDYTVVAGYISPSHDVYVSQKLGKEFIPSYHRLQMCDIAVADSTWIEADGWECSRSGFVSFKEVTAHLHRWLVKAFPSHKFNVMFLCGADLILRCHMTRLGQFSVVATGRPGYTPKVKAMLSNADTSGLYWIEKDMEDMSSTKIRNAIAQHKPLNGLTFESVVNYLKKYKLCN